MELLRCKRNPSWLAVAGEQRQLRGMVVLATIQSFIDAGDTVTAHHARAYPQCVHSGPLDLHMLADKLGPGFNIPENHAALMRRLRCTRCGTRGSGMSIVINPGSTGGMR